MPSRAGLSSGVSNAKSVSERLWQMSHKMRSNVENTLPTLIAQSSAL